MRRGLGLLELQAAIYLRLKNAMPDVSTFDAVPEDETFPYIVIGDETATDWSEKIGAGIDASEQVQVFSRADGFAEAKEIAGRVVDALTAGEFEVDGQNLVDLRLEGSETFRDEEDRRVVLRFTIRLQER